MVAIAEDALITGAGSAGIYQTRELARMGSILDVSTNLMELVVLGIGTSTLVQ